MRKRLKGKLKGREDWLCIAVCGNNSQAVQKTEGKIYGGDQQYIILGKTELHGEVYGNQRSVSVKARRTVLLRKRRYLGVPLFCIFRRYRAVRAEICVSLPTRGMSFNGMEKNMSRQDKAYAGE
jgi:hypothetical protein